MSLDALVAPLRADVVSGAAVVARTACEVMRRVAERMSEDTVEGVRDRLAEVAVKMLDAQPAMAPLVTLATEVLEAVEEADDPPSARRAVIAAANAFGRELERHVEDAGGEAAVHLPDRGTALTLSSSSTVRAALMTRAGDPHLRVICLESRPMNEGRRLAEALAQAGLEVIYAVDAAAGSLLRDTDVVLMGADSVGDRGVVNKLGSAAVARLATREGVPVVVATDRTKLLPPGFPQVVEDDRPPEEVWKAPVGVRVWNRYFETVSLDHVDALVTGEGSFSADEVRELRRSLVVPAALRRWAGSHGEGHGDSGGEPGPSSSV